MAQELETTPHQTIRNNLIIILCDLTVRYSAKVDPYIDTISACLKDPSLVRINTIELCVTLILASVGCAISKTNGFIYQFFDSDMVCRSETDTFY